MFPRQGTERMTVLGAVYHSGGNDVDRSGLMDSCIDELEKIKGC